MHNPAVDPQRYAHLIAAMNAKLKSLIDDELGTHDGDHLPMSGFDGWNLDVAIE
jgi:hypothetical protein